MEDGMKALTCAATRRRIHAYCDEELPVSDQIAVGSHLEWCTACAALHADFQAVGSVLRTSMPGRLPLSTEAEVGLRAGVVSRMKTERTLSFASQAREMFEDMRLVYAGAGGAAAAVVCIVIMLGMMRFAGRLPVSLVASVETSAVFAPAPPMEPHIQLPRPLDQAFSTADITGDSVIMMVAVVTREGTVVNLSLLDPGGGRSSRQLTQTKAVEDLLGAVSRARFEPARVDGLPVEMNMVWVVEHTTVRATHAVKKRAARIGPAAPVNV